MSGYPPPPASPGTSVRDASSSPASITMSELTGRSPRARPSTISIPTINTPVDSAPGVGPSPSLEKPTTPAEQLRSALERRAKRMRESSQLLVRSRFPSRRSPVEPCFSRPLPACRISLLTRALPARIREAFPSILLPPHQSLIAAVCQL